MPYIGIIDVIVGLFLFVFNLVYFFRGRKANRLLSITNGISGLFVALMYATFLFDEYIYDILSEQAIRAYCMRPITIMLLGALLANTLRMRWEA